MEPQQRRIQLRRSHIIAILLAGFGGFFVAQKLTAPTQSRTQAQIQLQQSAAARPQAASVSAEGEKTIRERLRAVLAALRTQAQRTEAESDTQFSLGLSQQKRAVVPAVEQPSTVAQPSASLLPTAAPTAVPAAAATLSPFIPSTKVSITGVARIRVEDVRLDASVDSQNRKSLTVQMRARNTGTAASIANTPIKLFMTMASGNSLLLGEQLVPPLEPGASVERKATYQCPESGTAQVCITIPPEFSVASTGSSPTTVCTTVTVPELAAPAASSTAPAATGTTAGTGSATSNADCLCHR
ncbi:hypothetical protein HZA86_05555 [Candidatus Uhrbacteria bacterium]|nr:hypothetical protein [Candidatus Uhrbacteria bacterium]